MSYFFKFHEVFAVVNEEEYPCGSFAEGDEMPKKEGTLDFC